MNSDSLCDVPTADLILLPYDNASASDETLSEIVAKIVSHSPRGAFMKFSDRSMGKFTAQDKSVIQPRRITVLSEYQPTLGSHVEIAPIVESPRGISIYSPQLSCFSRFDTTLGNIRLSPLIGRTKLQELLAKTLEFLVTSPSDRKLIDVTGLPIIDR